MIKYFLVAEQQCSLMVLVMVDAGVGRGLRYADLIAVNVIQNYGHVAALVRPHMNGLLSFESTIEQTTETMPSCPKTITAGMIKL